MQYLKSFLLLLFFTLNLLSQTTAKQITTLQNGLYDIKVTDFDIKVGGLPLQVNRTYSTLQRNEKLDFTYGWSIDYQNVKLQENTPPAEDWKVTPDVLIGSCFKFDTSHQVSIALPDGTTEHFEFRFARECGHYFTGSFYDAPKLYALNGSEAKLETLDASDSIMMTDSWEMIDGDTLLNYNPNHYRLTLSNGMVYDIKQNEGLTQVRDLRSDTLTYSDDGVQSSRGESLTFERDEQNRIVKITDLSGRFMTYHYNQNDDLEYVLDQLGQKTEYRYQAGHLLEEYYDPSGLRLTKNIYDESGRLIQTIDPDGNSVEFTHNIEGREEVIKDKLGRTSLFVYDDEGNVLSQTNPLGETTLRTYDTRGNELTVTDALGNTITNEYDNNDNLLRTIDPLGNEEVTTYNDKNSPTTISDKNGNVLNVVYNAYNNPRSFTTPLGATNTYYYDKFGNKIESINEYNQTTYYEYDGHFITLLGVVSSKGNLLKETQPNGTITEHTYDDNSNLLTTKTTTPEGVITTTSSTYDTFGRVISTTDARGQTTTNSYDARGNKISTTDAQNRTTHYTYSPSNKIILTQYPDGTSESKTYDAMDNLLSQTNAEEETTYFEYDDANRLIQTTYPDGTTTSNTYDAVGRVLKTTDQNGNSNSFEYDAVGNRVSTTDALGNVTTFTFDAQKHMLSATDAKGNRIEYDYDAGYNKVLTTYSDNTTKRNSYDISGNRLSSTNQKGMTTYFTYDIYNRLTQIEDALTNQTRFTYNSKGNKLTQTDAKNRTTSWSYDEYSRVVSRTLPLNQSSSRTYDTYGKLATTTDYNGQVTTYIYDTYDRLIEKNYDDGSKERYLYDRLGRTIGVTLTDTLSQEHTTTYLYDIMGRLEKETQPNGATLEYSYDNVGNLLILTLTNAQGETTTTTYSYDKLNRLKTVTSNELETTTYNYDAVGNQKSIAYHNGTKAIYTYDSLNRLIRLEHFDAQDNSLAFFEYTLSDNGERIEIAEQNKTTIYTYDALSRLLTEEIEDINTSKNYTSSYTYDEVSNRVASTIDGVSTNYTYDDNDRLLQQGGTNYIYDDNGNLLSETLDYQTTTYTYNAKNQLIKRENDKDTSTYTYNPKGIRVSKTLNDITTNYLVESNQGYAQVLQESEDDILKVNYTYGNDLLSQNRANKTTTYHYDGLGSARYLSNTNGVFTDSYNYEAFGKLLSKEGNTTNNYLYTGEQQDEESKQYYLRARYYAPTTGRFTQMDSYQGSQSDPITLHKYLYANANPLTYTDPTGYFSMMETSSAMGIANTLREVQLGSFNTLTDVLTGGWDGVSLDNIPEIAATAVGLRLFLRFVPTPKLKEVREHCSNSFYGESLILTEMGLRPIKEIKIGNKVWTYSENNQTKSLQEVAHIIKREGTKELLDIKLQSGEIITATSNHPFWTVAEQNWIEAGNLTLDNILLSMNDKNSSIIDLKTYKNKSIVYNLTVANNHTYFVGIGRILVHNQNKTCDIHEKALYTRLVLENVSFTETKRLVDRWDPANHTIEGQLHYDNLADSLLYHAKKHGFEGNLAKYLRKADAFDINAKNIKRTLMDFGRKKYKRKSGEYIIMYNDKIVSYGLN